MTVGSEAYYSWQEGQLIQQAFPELSKEEREVLITGFCFKCQKEIFALLEDPDGD
jgi:hypothetical protein